MTELSRGGAARARRTARTSGDDRELAILATAERLLAERPLSAVSVDDLAHGAGISRPTFYFYFASKDAVLLALVDRVVGEADAAMVRAERAEEGAPPGPDGIPRELWRRVIAAYADTFRRRRGLTLAWAQARSTNPEMRALWAAAFEAWVRRSARAIEAERSRGTAPPGMPARDLAVAVNSLNERVLYATLSGDGPAVADGEVVGVLLEIWLRAVYGATPTA